MADQCIVCLESLDVDSEAAPPGLPAAPDGLPAADLADLALAQPLPATAAGAAATTSPSQIESATTKPEAHENVALIEACGHILHESCLKEWTAKANSCPICRQIFYVVHVYDKVGGIRLSTFHVEDKKQVAEFDAQAWLDDNANAEDDDDTPCPICNLADREDILLLCDGCDTPYHTDCIGLGRNIPYGTWYCMECVDHLELHQQEAPASASPRSTRPNHGRAIRPQPRTQARVRRDRRRARQDGWQGAWGQLTGRVWNTLSIDLDYQNDDDPDVWEGYRRSQQLREREREEERRWQQRLNIASRLGARDVFSEHMPSVRSRPAHSPPQPPQETREERMAWGDFEKARDPEVRSNRKRKSRSGTAEPEPQQEPERKLKRPRTRRLPAQNGQPSASSSTTAGPSNVVAPASNSRPFGGARPSAGSPRPNEAAPSFLSSLLKEVEMSTPSDEDSIRNLFGPIPGANDPASPAASSPSASGFNSPRATSTTPPPYHGRPSSPPLSLSSHIEPIYPKANYSPIGASPRHHSPITSRDNSDSEHRSRRYGHPSNGYSPTASMSKRRALETSPDSSDSEHRAHRNGHPSTNYSPSGSMSKQHSPGSSSDSSDSEHQDHHGRQAKAKYSPGGSKRRSPGRLRKNSDSEGPDRRASHPKSGSSAVGSAPKQRVLGTSSDSSDSERRNHQVGSSEIRQPLPRRPQPAAAAALSRPQDAASASAILPREMKESISGIVRSALNPHWKSSKLTSQQYETINRQVSRRLYEEVADPALVDDEARRSWEKIATKEVARAVAELEA